MEFELTEQRQAYLEARGNVILNACPGSGKTTAIAKKLIMLEHEYGKTYGKFSGIACLSFTNTAKDEINEKYTELSGNYLGFPNKVSTIDSFINKYITLPFFYLFVEGGKRPKILDDPEFLNEAWSGKWKYKGKDGRLIWYAYLPSTIRFESDGTFSSNGYKPSPEKVELKAFKSYCNELKSWQIKSGLITTSDSAYIAYQLLSEYPQIGNWLALRFPHIIVDEAQDNSSIQHAIFDKLVELGLTNIEFVGDPYQSLYEWRDADPYLFIKKYNDAENWRGLDLTDDRRSPQRIINCFSLLRKDNDPIVNTGCTEDKRIPVFVYRYNSTNVPLILKHFDHLCKENELNKNQIVVRGNTLKNQMLGKKTDQFPWKSLLPYQIIEACYKYEGNEIKEAIKIMRTICVNLIARGKEYEDVKILEKELKNDNQFNATLLSMLHDLPDFKLTISDWTNQAQSFMKEKLELDEKVDFEIKNRSYRGKFDKAILSDSIDQHFKRSYSKSNIPITTIHEVKGKSLDSILVFFNEKIHKENITFSDIKSSGIEFPKEKQRLIYVALSRPKHLLAIAFPESVSENDIKVKFGNDVCIVNSDQLEDKYTSNS